MKDRTIVLNNMSGNNGEVLAKNRTHLIQKGNDGRIYARFNNPSQEIFAIKLTLTARDPFSQFLVRINDGEEGIKKANAAGILECRIPIPGLSRMTLEEIKSE